MDNTVSPGLALAFLLVGIGIVALMLGVWLVRRAGRDESNGKNGNRRNRKP